MTWLHVHFPMLAFSECQLCPFLALITVLAWFLCLWNDRKKDGRDMLLSLSFQRHVCSPQTRSSIFTKEVSCRRKNPMWPLFMLWRPHLLWPERRVAFLGACLAIATIEQHFREIAWVALSKRTETNSPGDWFFFLSLWPARALFFKP
jgi:hypothetical protein